MRIGVPERFGRRMSIGPFEHPRDFLRFLLFGSIAGLVTLLAGVLWGLLILVVGGALLLVRIREDSLLSLSVRVVAFHAHRHRGRPPTGTITAGGWRDVVGRNWRFYVRAPYPIFGRTAEDLHMLALRFTKILAGAHAQELILCRVPEPWDAEVFQLEARPQTPAFDEYHTLVQESCRGQFHSSLLLGIPFTDGLDRGTEENLAREGWVPLRGVRLQRFLSFLLMGS